MVPLKAVLLHGTLQRHCTIRLLTWGKSFFLICCVISFQGLRPDLPENAHPKLLDLMQRCWEASPDKRPSFSEITAELETLFEEVKEIGRAHV